MFFVAQAVGASLEDSDFVVEAFDKAKRDFVFWLDDAYLLGCGSLTGIVAPDARVICLP